MKTKYRQWFALTASTLGLTSLSFASGFGDEKYTYDASGNIVEKTIAGKSNPMNYDQGNRLIAGDGAEQSLEFEACDAAGLTINSTQESRKIAVSMNTGYGGKVLAAQNSNSSAGFYYNAEGHMVGIAKNGNLDVYVWDGLAMVVRGEQVFANEANPTGGLAVLASSEVVVSDIIGSTLSVGVKNYSSTAYGEGLEEVFMTGKPFVKELNGFVFQHRTYSPQIARWTLPDPSGFPDGKNNFIYTMGDPTNSFDPNGLLTITEVGPNYYAPPAHEFGKQHLTRTTHSNHQFGVYANSGSGCYFPGVTAAAQMSGVSTVSVIQQGLIGHPGVGGPADTNFRTTSDCYKHEHWHTTHDQTLANVTWTPYENWSSAYVGNEFGTMSEASFAGLSDDADAFSKANNLWNSNVSRTKSHEPRNSQATPMNVVDGVWRDLNADWGHQLNDSLADLTWSPSYVQGTCEY